MVNAAVQVLGSGFHLSPSEVNGMIGTKSGAPVKCALVVFAQADLDIERICREYSEEANPAEVFLVTGKSMGSALMGVSLEFLERGQLLPCPGLPLAGAAFDPDWGFARAVIGLHSGGIADFRLPPGYLDTVEDRETYGYRLCPIDHHEIPEAIKQLAHIRAELAKPRQPTKNPSINVTITPL